MAGYTKAEFLSTLSLRRATKYLTGGKIHHPDFYPRSPCGERLPRPTLCPLRGQFLSTLSLRRATGILGRRLWDRQQFLSTLSLRRATGVPGPAGQHSFDFYPRSPCGERRVPGPAGQHSFDFYPRSPCGERRAEKSSIAAVFPISIHALLAESDRLFPWLLTSILIFLSTLSLRRATSIGTLRTVSVRNFYPRSPCGERRQNPGKHYVAFRFLSTLSLRRATSIRHVYKTRSKHFYPRSPCGERLWANFSGFCWWVISIHALLAESDACTTTIITCIVSFLSTLSLRRATWHIHGFLRGLPISIHALLAESDLLTMCILCSMI